MTITNRFSSAIYTMISTGACDDVSLSTQEEYTVVSHTSF